MQAERFCTYLADTTEAQHLHHHLRYLVYCQRKHFEEGSCCETLPQERDAYDSGAFRFIVKDLIVNNWIGTSRLVPNEYDVLPAQKLGAIDAPYASTFRHETAAEVSRLSIVPVHQTTHYMGALLQSVIVGALDHSRHFGIDWLVFLVSPGLARVLERMGTPMEPCGPEIEHRGIRRAFRSNVAAAIESIPWAAPLRRGAAGYDLYSNQRQAA